MVSLYIAACATIERRLSALAWTYAQRGTPLDRKDRHITTALAGIRNTHGAPPRQKEAVLPEDLPAMLETLERGSSRGLRDRAMLLLGFAGGRNQTDDGRRPGGGPRRRRGDHACAARSAGGRWRSATARPTPPASSSVVALRTWLTPARIVHGTIFRRVNLTKAARL